MSAFAIAQAIGALALAHGLISFPCKSLRAILFWLAGSGFTMAAHFFVLGEPTPGLFYAIMGSLIADRHVYNGSTGPVPGSRADRGRLSLRRANAVELPGDCLHVTGDLRMFSKTP